MRFDEWKALYAPTDSGEDYDLYAAFKAGELPDANGHWTDRFKKPNHPTFSNESVYAVGAEAARAGRWDRDKFIPPKRAGVTLLGQGGRVKRYFLARNFDEQCKFRDQRGYCCQRIAGHLGEHIGPDEKPVKKKRKKALETKAKVG